MSEGLPLNGRIGANNRAEKIKVVCERLTNSMEVSRQQGPCGCQCSGPHQVGRLQKLLAPHRNHSSLSHTIASKSPTKDIVGTDYRENQEGTSTKTLEGVLRGQVPSLFSNLYRTSPSPDSDGLTTEVSPSPDLGIVRGSGLQSSSPPQEAAYGKKRVYSEIEQEEPIDLSCKKMRGKPGGSRLGKTTVETCREFTVKQQAFPQNSDDSQSGQKGASLLRNLLCLGKDAEPPRYLTHKDNNSVNFSELISLKSERSFSSGFDRHHISSTPTFPQDRLSPHTETGGKSAASKASLKVTLAKKNMLPVSARVSDWLVKIIRFAKSIPEFMSLLHNDKLALILNSWARLLLLYMAENNFQFAVTPDSMSDQTDVRRNETTASQENPTMKSVESVQTFIRKCQNMGTDSKEYAFLRMAVLFNAGIRGLDRPDVVDRVNSSVQQLLQQHVQACRPRDFMHYSRLLMSLPALYGINCKMIENLFCRHINGNMDMDVLLKEMLQNV